MLYVPRIYLGNNFKIRDIGKFKNSTLHSRNVFEMYFKTLVLIAFTMPSTH